MQAKICVINNKRPMVEFPNILIPTVPTINKGPELFVKLSSLSHYSLEQILFSLKSQAILAPTGYPLIKPITNPKAPSPLILNKGFIILFKNLPKILTKLVFIKSSVATKNGRSEGTTELAHKDNPFFMAGRLLVENNSKLAPKIKKIRANIFLFIFKI